MAALPSRQRDSAGTTGPQGNYSWSGLESGGVLLPISWSVNHDDDVRASVSYPAFDEETKWGDTLPQVQPYLARTDRAALPGVRGEDMKRPGRIWQILKWAGLAFSLTLFLGWAIPIPATLGHVTRPRVASDGHFWHWLYSLGRGRLMLGHVGYVPEFDPFLLPGVSFANPVRATRWLPAYGPATRGMGWWISIPLWIPFLVFASPTVYLFQRNRHHISPGHCQNCGYNLTGNVSGVCPECGERIWDGPRKSNDGLSSLARPCVVSSCAHGSISGRRCSVHEKHVLQSPERSSPAHRNAGRIGMVQEWISLGRGFDRRGRPHGLSGVGARSGMSRAVCLSAGIARHPAATDFLS